jgi:lipopolysaccharide export system permease protein
MTRITRYFLSEFIRPLFFCMGVLTVLILVSELLEHLDKFIAAEAGMFKVAVYLFSILPMRFVEILPVAALLAALFSLGNLSRRQEITAAMAGGVHPWRCAKPLLICGALLSLVAMGLHEWVVPPTNRRAQTLWKTEIRHFSLLHQRKFDQLTVAGRGGTFYAIGLLDLGGQRMENVAVDRLDRGRLAEQIQAKQAQWTGDRWIFFHGVERRFSPSGQILVRQEPFREKEMGLQDKPEDLVPQQEKADEMSYKDFKRHLRRLKALGMPIRRQQVDLYMKLSFPAANFIVLLIGVPFAMRKAGGKVRAIGFALGVAFFYFGLMQVGRALGQKPWCPPLLGAWLANLVFLAAGAYFFWKLKELS